MPRGMYSSISRYQSGGVARVWRNISINNHKRAAT